MDTFADGIDTSRATGHGAFTAFAGLAASLEGLSGEVTQETVLTTIKAMPEAELPDGGGLMFHCNGEQVPRRPGRVRARLARHDARRGGPANHVRTHPGIARTGP